MIHLLNRCTGYYNTCTEGSNPTLSASPLVSAIYST